MTPAEARKALDTASTEAEQARTLVADLAERVREGDEKITGEQILAQRQLAELAGLRVEAAERKLAAAEDTDRDARAKAIAAAARDLIGQDDIQPLLDAVRAAVDALHHLVTVTTTRTERIHTVAVQAVGINDELQKANPAAGPWPSNAYGFRAQTFPAHVAVLGEGTATAIRPGRMAATVLALALEGDRHLANEVRETFNAPHEHITERLRKEVPGLDEALRQPAES